MTTPRSKIWFHEYRRNGPRAAESEQLHDEVLNRWSNGCTKSEIAADLEIDKHTVRRITWMARKSGDPRGFAKTKPILQTQMECQSVLELYREQYIVRGLAKAFSLSHSQVETALRSIASELQNQKEPVDANS